MTRKRMAVVAAIFIALLAVSHAAAAVEPQLIYSVHMPIVPHGMLSQQVIDPPQP